MQPIKKHKACTIPKIKAMRQAQFIRIYRTVSPQDTDTANESNDNPTAMNSSDIISIYNCFPESKDSKQNKHALN